MADTQAAYVAGITREDAKETPVDTVNAGITGNGGTGKGAGDTLTATQKADGTQTSEYRKHHLKKE